MTNNPEKSVEEIVEEFAGKNGHLTKTLCNRGVWDEETQRWYANWLTQTLQAERQKREEMVEAERERVIKILDKRRQEYAQGRKKCGSSPDEQARAGRIEQREYALYEALEALTQPNTK